VKNKFDLSKVTGPSPELALAVARMMCKIAGWTETGSNEWVTMFRDAAGEPQSIFASKTQHQYSSSWRPDLDRVVGGERGWCIT
jgi:hypothetical protein